MWAKYELQMEGMNCEILYCNSDGSGEEEMKGHSIQAKR